MADANGPDTAKRTPPSSPLELWAGVECTLNRVGDEYLDQLEWTGHATRVQDLDLFADLGVSAMRYPVLWERTAPMGLDRADWSWPDERLGRLRELGVRPIVALLHHGSGPRHTSLLDPAFAEGLAAFAGEVARRYPWVEGYIPVNEPLTTARFGGLYGLWHPHGRDDGLCLRILLEQCRAVVLAMQAIRKINPAAQLVQTEDFGKTFSTPALRYQADFENERRFLTLDLLCGRLDRHHPMWEYFRRNGIEEERLYWFLEHPCPPDVVGFDHYLSSERYLDEHLERYPLEPPGSNGRDRFVDVLAARVRAKGPAGPERLLRETWERYGLPIAVTEAHNACYREEQLRWFMEIWKSAETLRQEGVDVRAVTAWAVLGAYGWDKLMTSAGGWYESGAFDVSGPAPRPTALGGLFRDLAAGREPGHPLLSVPGWWRRPDRLTYGFSISDSGRLKRVRDLPSINSRVSRTLSPIVITGATSALAQAFTRLCELRGIPYRALTSKQLDIADPASVEAALDDLQPWAVVNAAGYDRVEDAEADREQCFRWNAVGPAVLASACARRPVALLTFSSDLVFDGYATTPYVESDAVSPLNVYGQCKAEGEARALEIFPAALIVRTSALFGPWDTSNFLTAALRALAAGHSVTAADDQVVSPVYLPDLVHACLDLLMDGESGIWHLANRGEGTWASLVRRAARQAGIDGRRVEGRPTVILGLTAPQPGYSALGSERGQLLPSFDDALSRYLLECTALPVKSPDPSLDVVAGDILTDGTPRRSGSGLPG